MSLTPPPLRSGSVPARAVGNVPHVFGLLAFVIAMQAGHARADEVTFAPQREADARSGGGALAGIERAVAAKCAAGDAALTDMASQILARRRNDLQAPNTDAVAIAQRAAGEPHPWPKVWVASATVLGPNPTLQKFDAWLAELGQGSLRRCGVAAGRASDGSEVIVVVSVDALADLAPLPMRVRTGQWLSVAAHLRVHADGGKVIVLGPSGEPQPLPTSFDGKTLRAWFAPDGPGEFAVQVVADVASGPRPVLDTRVFADVDPPVLASPRPAPGEENPLDGQDEETALARMITGARAWAGLAPLERDARLDAVARNHAVRIARARRLAHDAGDGDPAERLRAAGVDAHEVGENLATAPNALQAHRATWASPSHRANILRRDFDRVGLAVTRDSHGDVWLVEMFTSELE